MKTQKKISALPDSDQLLVESCTSKEGGHLFVFSFAGRRVNEGLAILIAWRMSRSLEDTYRVWANDYGLEILSLGKKAVDTKDLRTALSVDSLLTDLKSDFIISFLELFFQECSFMDLFCLY